MAIIELEIKKEGRIIRTHKFTGPAGWADMQQKQLLIWAAVMFSKVEVYQAKVILAANLYGIPFKILSKVLDRKERFRLSLAVNYLFKKNQLYKWVIPSIRYGLRRYYGPKDKLSNLTAGEFTLCEFCFEKFEFTKDLQYLELLAAILYRPKRWFNIDDDIREPLKTISYEKRAAQFKKLPARVKIAIYLNYEGCRNFIIKSCPNIFNEGGRGLEKQITSWSKIIQNGAGGIFGNLKETEQSNIHKFLSELDTRIKEHKANPNNG